VSRVHRWCAPVVSREDASELVRDGGVTAACYACTPPIGPLGHHGVPIMRDTAPSASIDNEGQSSISSHRRSTCRPMPHNPPYIPHIYPYIPIHTPYIPIYSHISPIHRLYIPYIYPILYPRTRPRRTRLAGFVRAVCAWALDGHGHRPGGSQPGSDRSPHVLH
jgi:hypothetical protein